MKFIVKKNPFCTLDRISNKCINVTAPPRRYRPVGTPIYSTTELLHHSRGGALLAELRAHSRYEAALVLAPPPRAPRELYDPTAVHFTTLPYLGTFRVCLIICLQQVLIL